MSDRRRGARNRFKFKRNYIIPLICVIITSATLIISSNIISDLKQKIKENDLKNNLVESTEITKEDTIAVNKLFSFLWSNLDYGQDITDELTKYYLTCKSYGRNNVFNQIPEQYITALSEETYRNTGYIYFEDLKDTYYCITKTEYVSTYTSLFDEETMDLNLISKYYISDIDSYLVPKDNNVNSNSEYKVNEIRFNQEENIYIATLLEVNLIKLYEQKDMTQIEQYLNSSDIDNGYLSGNKLEVKLKKQGSNLVFAGYSI